MHVYVLADHPANCAVLLTAAVQLLACEGIVSGLAIA